MERPARRLTRADRVRQRRQRISERPAKSTSRRKRVAAAAAPTATVVSRYRLGGAVPVPGAFPGARVGERTSSRRGRAWAQVWARLAGGWRWLSAALLFISLAGLYALLKLPAFQVQEVELHGLHYLNQGMLQGVLPLGRPAATVDPQETAQLLLTTFPALAEARVWLDLKGVLQVQVLERQPVLVWVYQGNRWWVDPQGVLFPALGDDPLPEVQARDLPPGIEQTEGQWRLPADLVQALQVLAAYVPEGQPLVYDAHYGLGWQAPEGWQVFVGKRPTQMAARMRLYWALRQYLRAEGLPPAWIDLSVLNAPYYRLEP